MVIPIVVQKESRLNTFWALGPDGPLSLVKRQKCRRGRKWEGVPFFCRLGSLGSVVSSPSGVRGTESAEKGFGGPGPLDKRALYRRSNFV